MTLKKIHTINNEKGLHARASAKFVETVECFNANAEISKDGINVSGDRIMGLLMNGAAKGNPGPGGYGNVKISGDYRKE